MITRNLVMEESERGRKLTMAHLEKDTRMAGMEKSMAEDMDTLPHLRTFSQKPWLTLGCFWKLHPNPVLHISFQLPIYHQRLSTANGH